MARRTREAFRGGLLGVGALLAAYGTLVVARVLAHEAPSVGFALVATGVVLLWAAALGAPSVAPSRARSGRTAGRRGERLTLALGAVCLGGVALYNLLLHSTWSPPELLILAYGSALLAAAGHLARRVGPTDVGTLVMWSVPLLAAPLAVYAVEAGIESASGSSPLDGAIAALLVSPLQSILERLGLAVTAEGQTLVLATPRGTLALTVGMVCAGLQPSILFLGIVALHAWRERMSARELAVAVAVGLVGVYLANLTRLLALALVGYAYGGSALVSAHAHGGWVVFVGWMLVYWGLLLPGLDALRHRARRR